MLLQKHSHIFHVVLRARQMKALTGIQLWKDRMLMAGLEDHHHTTEEGCFKDLH